jgi:hypothetical protein
MGMGLPQSVIFEPGHRDTGEQPAPTWIIPN